MRLQSPALREGATAQHCQDLLTQRVLAELVRDAQLPGCYRDYVAHLVMTKDDEIDIPTMWKQAKASSQWKQWKAAMKAELQSLKKHKACEVVQRGSALDRKVSSCRWVFAVKRDGRGTVKRFKARLLIYGFKQEYGTDYLNTYAPVTPQYDVKTAFCTATLRTRISWSSRMGSRARVASSCADYARVSTD